MNPWQPVATKGCLNLDVLTERRACAEGFPPCDAAFLMRVLPDDSDAHCCWSPTVESLRIFIREMQPRRVRIFVGDHESEDAIRAALDGKLQ